MEGKESFPEICYDGGWLYYCKYDGDRLYYRKSDDVEDGGDWMPGTYLYRCKADGSQSELCCVIGTGAEVYINFTVEDSWVYYRDFGHSGNQLYRMKTDGSERKALSDANDSGDFFIINHWIYYYHRNSLWRVLKTGGAKTEISTAFANSAIYDWDGKYIYYTTRSGDLPIELYRMSPDGKTRERIHTFEPEAFSIGNVRVPGNAYYTVRRKPLFISYMWLSSSG
jgi:hypothetical protein